MFPGECLRGGLLLNYSFHIGQKVLEEGGQNGFTITLMHSEGPHLNSGFHRFCFCKRACVKVQHGIPMMKQEHQANLRCRMLR